MDPKARIAKFLLALGFGLGMIVPCNGQDLPGDIRSGKRLAETWCSACHRTDGNAGVVDGAPDFYSIANLPSTTALSLRVFLQTNHKEMPNFHIAKSDADDVIAYVLSLRKN
jgi:mono/diheme cytochrome c family protein